MSKKVIMLVPKYELEMMTQLVLDSDVCDKIQIIAISNEDFKDIVKVLNNKLPEIKEIT